MYDNVYTPVATITKSPVRSSGICKVLYFLHNDVVDWPAKNPETGIISDAITLKPGKSFYVAESAEKNKVFTESEKDSDAGTFMDILVTVEHGANPASNILALSAMKYYRFGLIVFDRDRNQRLIGNADQGAKLLFDYTSGDYFSSRRRKLSWHWQHSEPAPIFSNSLIDVVIGGDGTGNGGSTSLVTFLMQFRVGDPEAPMTEVDTTLTSSLFTNKRLLVVASGLVLTVDDNSGDIDWTGSIERHYLKTLSQDTITFFGGVTTGELIQIYAVN